MAKQYDSDRPMTFAAMMGNAKTFEELKNSVTAAEPSRVYFLTGPTGSGKTTTARVLARALLCKNRLIGNGEPCGYCPDCTRKLDYYLCSNEDYIEYAGEDLSATDMIDNDFRHEFLKPHRVICLDELQDLDKSCQRLLRKTLENSQSYVIATTTHGDQIEDALRNRLIAFHHELKYPSADEIVDYLVETFERAGMTYESREQLMRVATGYNCAPRNCSQFPDELLRRAKGRLTDEYLDRHFKEVPISADPPAASKRRSRAVC